jgi:hypothetical protein
MKKNLYIYGGGTFNRIAPHLSLAAPAFGTVATQLAQCLERRTSMDVKVVLTKMALGNERPCDTEARQYWDAAYPQAPTQQLVSTNDVASHLSVVVDDLNTKVVVMTCAICDFQARVVDCSSMPVNPDMRLDSTTVYEATLTGVPKILPIVRQLPSKTTGKPRKDIFLVAFKATSGESIEGMWKKGVALLKRNSCNLVLVNDVKTRMNMIVTPEESSYHITSDRRAVLEGLAEMICLRSNLTFTQSTVTGGALVPWNSDLIPNSLRTVVNHCIRGHAYKTFENSTVGHFAVKLKSNTFLTSVRRSNFNDLGKNGTGMVLIQTDGPDTVLAYGAKPSVGGQSQRQVFADHTDCDCIFHAHVPLRKQTGDVIIPIVSQYEFECGSHQCGKNTSQGLATFTLGDGKSVVKAVHLDNHGPNIVFNRDVRPDLIIDFIEQNWDLSKKTTGLQVSEKT